MINKITVSENRGLYPIKSNLGTIGERNATELVFQLPLSLQGYALSLVIVTAQGSFVYNLTDNTFTLPSEVLTDNTLDLQLVLKDGETVVWKSIPTTFFLNPTLDGSGENAFDDMKKQWTVEAQRPLTIFVNYLTEMFESFKTKGGNDK